MNDWVLYVVIGFILKGLIIRVVLVAPPEVSLSLSRETDKRYNKHIALWEFQYPKVLWRGLKSVKCDFR